MTLAGIYATFGYGLYVLCDIYLSIADKYKEQLLSYADYLLKCDRGKDFNIPTEEKVSEMFPIEKFNDYDAYLSKIKDDILVELQKETSED